MILFSNTVLLLGIVFVAVALTCAMFATKNVMLGFPCVIFWAIAGGQAYTLSVATWDIYYFMFIGSVLGMAIFSALAMYGLRKKDLAPPDIGEGKYIDEDGSLDLPTPEVEKLSNSNKKKDERELSPRERADERRMKREEK